MVVTALAVITLVELIYLGDGCGGVGYYGGGVYGGGFGCLEIGERRTLQPIKTLKWLW